MGTAKPSTQSAAERRSAESELRALIDDFASDHEPLIGSLRKWLQKRLPGAHELVYEYADCFVVSYSPNEHGYLGVFAIRANEDGVKLYFNSGKGLKDPQKLLQGTAKLVRWIDIEDLSTLTNPAVLKLVDEAIARTASPFVGKSLGPVVIRPGAAQKRRKGRSD
jgi:hypothetical protein